MERMVARVWQQALGIPSVGLTDNFFDLGAHSLTVAEAHAKLQEALGREIPCSISSNSPRSARSPRIWAGAQAATRRPAGSQIAPRAAEWRGSGKPQHHEDLLHRDRRHGGAFSRRA